MTGLMADYLPLIVFIGVSVFIAAALAGRAVPGRLQQPRSREAVGLRVRLQRLRRRAHEVRRALLPRRDPVHHLRPRSRVPVPVGDHLRRARMVRHVVDDGLPRRSDRRLRLRVAQGRPRMGLVAPESRRPRSPSVRSLIPRNRWPSAPTSPAPRRSRRPPKGSSIPTRACRSAPTIRPSCRSTDELADRGFLVTVDGRPHQLGPHRLADVDDLRPRLLRRRDDADVDAALRLRALRLRAARQPAPVRRDDRRRHADQQDGARPCARSTTRCRSRATSSRWAPAPTAAATTTTPTRWCAAATGSCRWTSTCRAARPPPRRCSTACSCSRRRSAAPARSSAEEGRPA